MVSESPLDGVATEPPPSARRKERVGGGSSPLVKPRLEELWSCSERAGCVAPSSPCRACARWRRGPRDTSSQLSPTSSEIRSPVWMVRANIGVIASAGPTPQIAGLEQRGHLVLDEVGDQVGLGPLLWDRKDALDRARMLGVVQCEVGKERVDRREAHVAGGHGVPPVARRGVRGTPR